VAAAQSELDDPDPPPPVRTSAPGAPVVTYDADPCRRSAPTLPTARSPRAWPKNGERISVTVGSVLGSGGFTAAG
jgi:hypothetical protein